MDAHAGVADALMTAERTEEKYVVPRQRAQALVQLLSQRLKRHRFTGEGANPLPQPRHYVTTVYFDNQSRQLFRAAVASDKNLKLRAKEYYDLHPDLLETVTDAKQLVRYRPTLWLEIKAKEGTLTGKRRLGIPKCDVPAFFDQGVVTPGMLRIQERLYGADAQGVLREVGELIGRLSEPVRADCLVNYRRVAWQDDTGTLRITIDLGLAFFAPPEDLWQRDYALVRETLGTPMTLEHRCVLEVKSRQAHPAWIATVLAEAGAVREAYSKFETASRAVHG